MTSRIWHKCFQMSVLPTPCEPGPLLSGTGVDSAGGKEPLYSAALDPLLCFGLSAQVLLVPMSRLRGEC